MVGGIGWGGAHLPPIPTNRALAKRRHRLIGRPRLGLGVRHLLLPALSALELIADALFRHGHLRLLHVLLLQLLVARALLLGRQVAVRQRHEAVGGHGAGQHAPPQLEVVLALEGREERAALGAVGLVLGALEGAEHGGLDLDGARDDFLDGFGGLVGEAVVEHADRVVARGVAGALEFDAVGFEVALLGVARVGLAEGGWGRGG